MELIIAALPWALSVNTIALTFLVGRKSILGWVLGVVGQSVWALYIVTRQEWGLGLMWAGLTVAYTWNLITWYRDEHKDKTKGQHDG
jgi:hypothetical protein